MVEIKKFSKNKKINKFIKPLNVEPLCDLTRFERNEILNLNLKSEGRILSPYFGRVYETVRDHDCNEQSNRE